jgi:hypothetical protein
VPAPRGYVGGIVCQSPANRLLVAQKFARKFLADYGADLGRPDSCDASQDILARSLLTNFAEKMRGDKSLRYSLQIGCFAAPLFTCSICRRSDQRSGTYIRRTVAPSSQKNKYLQQHIWLPTGWPTLRSRIVNSCPIGGVGKSAVPLAVGADARVMVLMSNVGGLGS